MATLQAYVINKQIPNRTLENGSKYIFKVHSRMTNTIINLTVPYHYVYLQYNDYRTTFNEKSEDFSQSIRNNEAMVDALIVNTDHHGNVTAECILITPFGEPNRFDSNKEDLWSFLKPKDSLVIDGYD